MAFSQNETANYLGSASREMAKLAEDAGLETLSYLFKMAEKEAQEIQTGPSLTVKMHRALSERQH